MSCGSSNMNEESEDVVITSVKEAGVVNPVVDSSKMNNSKVQARLPFRPLDQQGVLPPSKKRKLSDDEVMCRTLRTSGSKLIDKKVTPVKGSNKVVIMDENEVSSSSEPEPLQNEKKTVRAGLLKFFCPAQLKEVSTSVPTEGKIETIEIVDSDKKQPSIEAEKEATTNSDKKQPPIETTEKQEVTTEPRNETTSSIEDCATTDETPEKDDSDNGDLNIAMSGSDDSMMDVSMEEDREDTSLIESSQSGDERGEKRTLSSTSLNTSTTKVKTPKTGQKKSQKQLEREQELAEKKRLKEEARLEKEKKRQEEKEKKQEEKTRKEKERLEKKEAFEKEKQEKLKAKEEKKEAERLKKEEERKEKEAEKAKKDEEKKMKLGEKKKEEEEMEKKKAHQKASFLSFFKKTEKSEDTPGADSTSGMFMAFVLKKGMVLAPARRTKLETSDFDQSYQEQGTSQKLYLQELSGGLVKPRRCAKTIETKDRDLIVLDEDAPDFYKAKFLKFRENNRPAYYGTFRKTSKLLSAKNPFKKDESLFDYEVDSDDEWEEEEPGESLSDSEGEEEKDTEEKDEEGEDEDGFFVPHGYLSDGEGCEEDDDSTPEKMKAKQQAKQRAFEVELKKQCQKLVPVIIGLCWQNSGSSTREERLLSELQCVPLVKGPVLTSLCAPTRTNEPQKRTEKGNTDKRIGAITRKVPEEAMPDLIRLFHGNVHNFRKLSDEFRAFWHRKTSDKLMDTSLNSEMETGPPAPTTPQSVSSPSGEMSLRQLKQKIKSIAQYRKGEYRYNCWYVKDEVLKQYGLESLPVPTEWVYITDVVKPGVQSTPKDVVRSTPTGPLVKPASRIDIKQFAVKTTSDDLFTSPSAASPKLAKSMTQSPLASTPTQETSPSTAKPPRRVQLKSLSMFLSKDAMQAQLSAELAKPIVGKPIAEHPKPVNVQTTLTQATTTVTDSPIIAAKVTPPVSKDSGVVQQTVCRETQPQPTSLPSKTAESNVVVIDDDDIIMLD